MDGEEHHRARIAGVEDLGLGLGGLGIGEEPELTSEGRAIPPPRGLPPGRKLQQLVHVGQRLLGMGGGREQHAQVGLRQGDPEQGREAAGGVARGRAAASQADQQCHPRASRGASPRDCRRGPDSAASPSRPIAGPCDAQEGGVGEADHRRAQHRRQGQRIRGVRGQGLRKEARSNTSCAP